MSTQFARYDHVHRSALFPLKTTVEEGTPTVYQQAEMLGGTFTRILYGLPDHVADFSPSICKYNGRTFIAWRTQPEAFGFRYDNKYFYLNEKPTEVWLGELINDKTIVGAKSVRRNKHRLSHEDPRLFVGGDDLLYLQMVTSAYASKYDKRDSAFTQAKVAVALVDNDGYAVSAVYPPIGKNREKGAVEKNWCFFNKDNELHCLYSTRDIVIEKETKPNITIKSDVLKESCGDHATFNSLAPLDLGDSYLVFYHWKHMAFEPNGSYYLKYHLGAYTLDKALTRIESITTEPLFTGSVNDGMIWWTNYAGQKVSRQPALVLPFGALIEGDELVMSCGVNDAYMGIFRTKVQNILEKMKSV